MSPISTARCAGATRTSLGPFELWDALGFEDVCKRLESDGRTLPESVEKMRSAGAMGFYRPTDAGGVPRMEVFDLSGAHYTALEEPEGIIRLADFRRARNVVQQGVGGSLVDIGDGVLCLEMHPGGGLTGEEQARLIHAAVKEAERNFEAMVVTTEGDLSVAVACWRRFSKPRRRTGGTI